MTTISVDTLIDRSVKRMGDVHVSLKEYTIELIKRCYKEGLLVQISSGYRSNVDQAYIYGQGRPSYTWNGKKYGSSGSIVSNAQPGTSVHNYGLAIDYFLVSDDGNQSLWTVNDKWKRVAVIAKSMGFEWGGDWTSFKDYPHLQFTKGLTIAQLKAGKRPTFPKLETITREEEVRMFKPTTGTLKNELVLLLEEAHKEGLLSSDEHAKKARTGELTLDDAIGLQATILRRKLASLKK